MIRLAFLLLTFVLVAAGGLLHGAWSQRWQKSAELVEAAALLQRVPHTIDGWRGTDLPVEDSQAEQVLHRRYEKGGQRVTIALECGRAGRMAVFSPTAFFPDYDILDVPDRRDVKVNDKDAEVATTLLRKKAGSGSLIRVFGSWKEQDNWEAPTNLKWHYRGQPYLYRIYLAYEVPHAELKSGTANSELAAQWLGRIDKILGTR